MWNTACPDWEERLLAGRSLVPDLPLFAAERDRALRVFNRLRLADVVGKPEDGRGRRRLVPRHRRRPVRLLDPDTNRRMIQELFLLVPEEERKTTYAATTMLTGDHRQPPPGRRVRAGRPDHQHRRARLRAAKGAIKADPELDKVFHTQDHIQTITHRGNDATLAIKAADTDVITGSLATGTLIDETHVFAKKSRAAEIFVEIRGALAASAPTAS
jgi:phage terminase large subunit-like protein